MYLEKTNTLRKFLGHASKQCNCWSCSENIKKEDPSVPSIRKELKSDHDFCTRIGKLNSKHYPRAPLQKDLETEHLEHFDTSFIKTVNDPIDKEATELYGFEIKAPNSFMQQLNDADNNAYHEALHSLEVTKVVMEDNLSNVSWFQRLWNNKAYENYQKSIQTLDEEIALFKDLYRNVFTRSSMPRTLFKELKSARE